MVVEGIKNLSLKFEELRVQKAAHRVKSNEREKKCLKKKSSVLPSAVGGLLQASAIEHRPSCSIPKIKNCPKITNHIHVNTHVYL